MKPWTLSMSVFSNNQSISCLLLTDLTSNSYNFKLHVSTFFIQSVINVESLSSTQILDLLIVMPWPNRHKKTHII